MGALESIVGSRLGRAVAAGQRRARAARLDPQQLVVDRDVERAEPLGDHPFQVGLGEAGERGEVAV